jgi:hypothetical protein
VLFFMSLGSSQSSDPPGTHSAMPRTRTGYRNVCFSYHLWTRLVERIAVIWPREPECEQTVWVLPGCEVVSRAGD